MELVIRDARREDMESVLELVNELALFEKEPDAVVVTVDDLQRDGFGDDKLFHCFVAEVKNGGGINDGNVIELKNGPTNKDGATGHNNDEIVGMALVYPRYSTWKGPVIHLEDLIVTEKMRGSGLGSALLAEVVKYGSEKGVKRISWEVLDWNEPAIKFYESKGANVMRDWDVVQLDEEGIKQFLDNL